MRIAVLGLGFMGSMHLKALRNIPKAKLAAVVSTDEKKLAGDLSGIQGNLGGPGAKLDFSQIKKYRSVAEALADSEIDAVDICLPTDQHAPVTIAALRAGKHVLVEKPMALDGAGADRMLVEAEASGRILMTGQVLRFIPGYRIAAEILKSARLGPVHTAFFRRRCAAPAWGRWLGDASKSGGGVFDLLIHDVDFCLHLFGPPSAVSARGYEAAGRGIDWILAEFHYPSIGSVSISGGWHHPRSYPFSMEFTVLSEGGTLEYSSLGRPLTLYRADGEVETLEPQDQQDWFQEELAYFIDCAAAGRKPELCPPEESATAVKLTRLMLESRHGNGEKIACSL